VASKPLRLLATGGTIASRVDETGAAVPTVAAADLVAATPGLDALGPIEVEEIDRVNGWNVTPATMLRVAERARVALCEEGAAGVVVTHGTDTIEETLYLVDLLAGDATDRGPIVFGCAMRNASQLGADGPRNLLHAALVARDPAARGRGALLSINDEVHAARWATKTDTLNVATFRSPEAGPVGRIEDGRLRFGLPSPPRPPHGERVETDVALVKVYTGMDAEPLRWYLDRGVKGLVVEGTGAGHVPGPVADGIAEAIGRGVPVVLTSRCWTGRTAATYGGPGGGVTLEGLGVLRANGLNSQKARLALMVALGVTTDPHGLRDWFAHA
jgi:L-asparaginase